MEWQYKSVPVNGTKPPPTGLTLQATVPHMSVEEFARLMEQAINDQSLEGWELIQLHSYSAAKCVLIFRKPGSVGKGYADRADR